MVGDSPDGLDAYLDEVLIGGREPVRVVISDYDPTWPARSASEQERLAAVLGDRAVAIEHIGSTAVPGLGAKAIIDILVTVDTVEPDDAFRPQLEAAGYVLRVREEEHRMFKTAVGDVNIHVWPTRHEAVQRYLVFRDWLRNTEEDRLAYEVRKRELADREWPDVNHYAEAKSGVIGPILERAFWSLRH